MKWLAGVIAFGAMVLVWIGGFLVYRSMDDTPKQKTENHVHQIAARRICAVSR